MHRRRQHRTTDGDDDDDGFASVCVHVCIGKLQFQLLSESSQQLWCDFEFIKIIRIANSQGFGSKSKLRLGFWVACFELRRK